MPAPSACIACVTRRVHYGTWQERFALSVRLRVNVVGVLGGIMCANRVALRMAQNVEKSALTINEMYSTRGSIRGVSDQ